jgi:hypothetical protein
MSMSTETLGKALILTPPDNEIMNAARQNILTQASALKLDFLPVMKEKMLPLQTALKRADKVYRDNLASVTVQLNSMNLQPIDLKQQQIEADQRLSDKQKQQAISLLNTQRIRQVSNLSVVVRNSAKAIAEHSDDMAQINLKLEGNRLLETLQEQIDSMTLRSAALESTMGEIAADRIQSCRRVQGSVAHSGGAQAGHHDIAGTCVGQRRDCQTRKTTRQGQQRPEIL